MTDFEKVLAECLLDLEQGVSNVDECLRRHPSHSLQLEPVLLTAAYLQHGREARPSAAFKARVRAKLTQDMKAHPRKTYSFEFLSMRPAASLLAIVLALILTGTAYAQSALPGDTFYTWKRASENAWRAVSPDPTQTDLALVNRRVDELIAVRDDPALHAEALQSYLEVAARLQSEMNAENAARILQALESQLEELNNSGIPVPQLDQDVPPQLNEALPTPVVTHLPGTEIPQVNPTLPVPTVKPTDPAVLPELPPVVPTKLPDIVPTVQVPPNIIPTDLIPTIDIPPLLP
jgi:hypothetical protein